MVVEMARAREGGKIPRFDLDHPSPRHFSRLVHLSGVTWARDFDPSEVRRPREERRIKERMVKEKRKEKTPGEKGDRADDFSVLFVSAEVTQKGKERNIAHYEYIPRNILLYHRIYVRFCEVPRIHRRRRAKFTINLLHPFGRKCQSQP